MTLGFMRKSGSFGRAARIAVSFILINAAGRAADAPEDRPVTWYADIAPLVREHCLKCHRPGQIGPMSLLSYEDARPWAKAIRDSVVRREMPPWHADPEVGRWVNDPSLTAEEIELFRRWADEGALKGDPADLPEDSTVPSGEWLLGEPDIILKLTKPVVINADVKDVTLYRVADCRFEEDKWISAAEFRVSNFEVAHHAIAFVLDNAVIRKYARNPEELFNFNGMITEASAVLLMWTPGADPRVCPEGQGVRIPADSSIVFDLHYHKEKPEVARDNPRLALKLCDSPPRSMAMPLLINSDRLEIPPRVPRFENTERMTLTHETEIQWLILHMHFRGKGAELWAHPPGADPIALLDVPRYDFNWQHTYYPVEPIRLPAGTELVATAWFDNSADNPLNPDPDVTVRYGPESDDEMMSILMDVVRPGGMPAVIEQMLAENLERAGMHEEAAAHYEAAVRDAPGNAATHNNLGLHRMRRGDSDGAVRAFESALRIQDDYGHARMNLALCLINLGRTDEAERHFLKVFRTAPDTAGLGYNLGNLYLKRRNYKEAIRFYERESGVAAAARGQATGAHGLPLGDYHFNYGMALFMDARYPLAVRNFEQAVRLNPGDAPARNYLGMAVASTGDLRSAVDHFRQAVRLKPDYTEARENLERAEGFLRQAGAR